MKVDAIILGGGTLKDSKETRLLSKALVEINGKPMIDYVITALKEAPSIEQVLVLAPLSAQYKSWTRKVDHILVARESMIENLKIGLDCLESKGSDSSLVLLISCDIPLITPRAIEDFLKRCQPGEAEIFYSIISKKDIQSRYPRCKRTYVTLKEGVFTGGNLSLVSPSAIRKNFHLLEKAYSLRKSPFQLASVLGFKFILKFLIHTLSISEAEERVSSLLNARSKAVITPYPEIGIDVDKEDDLQLVRKVLSV